MRREERTFTLWKEHRMLRSTILAAVAIAAGASAGISPEPSTQPTHPLVGKWCHVLWEGGRPENGTVVSLDAEWLVLRAEQEADKPLLWLPRQRIKGIAAFDRHPIFASDAGTAGDAASRPN